MKKDIPLIFERIIYTYIVVLIATFIMKLIGLDYFGISMSSPFIIQLDKAMQNYAIKNILFFILIALQQYVTISIVCNKEAKKFTLITLPFLYILEAYVKNISIIYNFNMILEILYLFILCIIYNKINKGKEKIFKRFVIFNLINLVFQFISMITRFKYTDIVIQSPSINIILNIDYIMMLLILYKLHFMEGDKKLCGIYQVEVFSFLQKLTSLKKLLKKYQTNYSKYNKKEKFEFNLYFALFLLWNLFTLLIVLFIAQLNHTFIECLFIITSFWLNKTIFGKAFHLKNALHCFILSNLVYFILNRITTPTSISILVPIFLGILLSYLTSKLVKKDGKPLYRGMSEEELKEKLNKITTNELDYKICKLYYVDRYSELKVAMVISYSIYNIKKRKKVINDKLKELII